MVLAKAQWAFVCKVSLLKCTKTGRWISVNFHISIIILDLLLFVCLDPDNLTGKTDGNRFKECVLFLSLWESCDNCPLYNVTDVCLMMFEYYALSP